MTSPAAEFFTAVWGADDGSLPHNNFIAELIGGRWKHHPVETVANAVRIADRISASGRDAYFACAGFKTTQNRKGDNAAGAYSFWLDVDCGSAKAAEGKGYATQGEAVQAVKDFCAATGLPRPPVVMSSGYGVHAYWPLTDFVEAARWRTMATKLKRLAGHHGFLADPSRTADISSVLRPPETQNFKNPADPKPVEILRMRAPIRLEAFADALEAASPDGGDNDGGVNGATPTASPERLGPKLAREAPSVESMRAMLTYLAEQNYFRHRSGVEKSDAGRIIGLGWIETGGALKAAYGDEVGSELWGVTHKDDKARADAPAQWKSFASEFKPGHVTVGTVILAAKDAGFPMRLANSNAVPDGYVSFGPFQMDAVGGLTKAVTVLRGKTITADTQWISAGVEVLGKSRAPDGKGWGKQLRFKDGDGRAHMLQVTDAELHGDPAPLCAKLADNGMTINRDRQREFQAYLAAVNVEKRVTVVGRTGWHEIGGRNVFVLPSETIGADAYEAVALDAVAHGPYEARCSLEDWQNGVGKLTAGHALPVLGVSAALCGPLMQIVEAEGGGVHLVASSSVGKSSVLAAAASVWGRGDARGGFTRSWRSTANGLEGMAAASSDTCMILDELGVGEGRDVGAAVYALANGLGKARAGRDGSARDPRSWRVITVSSGEISIATKIGEDRGRVTRAGQLVRLLDIPADRGLGFGAFDSTGGFTGAGQFADAIKTAACIAYGTAGPEFVRRILNYGVERVAAEAQDCISRFVAKVIKQGGGDQVGRAAKKFALIAVAGELATGLGITPWAKGEARRAAEWAFARWLEQRGGGGSHEAKQAVEQIRRMIEQHGESRFDQIGRGNLVVTGVRDRLGWRKGEGLEREWLVPPELWRTEFCAGLDPTLVARTLAARGMLRRQDAKNLASVVALGGQRIRAYILTAKILDGDEG